MQRNVLNTHGISPESEKAKAAVVEFVHGLFGKVKISTVEEMVRIHKLIEPFASPGPMPNARYSGNQALDLYCPSFWHACCAILYHWMINRFTAVSQDFEVSLYRGQANTWRLRPSLWRATVANRDWLHIIKSFLQPTNQEADNSSILFYPDFVSDRDVDIIFTENEILQFFDNDLGHFASRLNHRLVYDWYAAFDYYAAAMDTLKHFCYAINNTSEPAAVEQAMRDATKQMPRPLTILNDFGASRMSLTLSIAESMASAANAIYDNVMGVGAKGRFVNKHILKAYVAANPAFFEAFFEISKKVSIFSIDYMAQEFKTLDGIEALVRGSLSKEQIKYLETLTDMHYLEE